MPRTTAKGTGKRYPLGMRTTKELRESLERSAAKSGRSLAQEVEFRLEQSIERDQRNTLTFGYANQSRPLIVHKGSLILVLDPNTAIDLEIKPAELQTLMRYIKHWQDELK